MQSHNAHPKGRKTLMKKVYSRSTDQIQDAKTDEQICTQTQRWKNTATHKHKATPDGSLAHPPHQTALSLAAHQEPLEMPLLLDWQRRDPSVKTLLKFPFGHSPQQQLQDLVLCLAAAETEHAKPAATGRSPSAHQSRRTATAAARSSKPTETHTGTV